MDRYVGNAGFVDGADAIAVDVVPGKSTDPRQQRGFDVHQIILDFSVYGRSDRGQVAVGADPKTGVGGAGEGCEGDIE